jgi:hypothetical protein
MEQPITGSVNITSGDMKSTLTMSEAYFGIAESLMPAARVLAASTAPGTGLGQAFK